MKTQIYRNNRNNQDNVEIKLDGEKHQLCEVDVTIREQTGSPLKVIEKFKHNQYNVTIRSNSGSHERLKKIKKIQQEDRQNSARKKAPSISHVFDQSDGQIRRVYSSQSKRIKVETPMIKYIEGSQASTDRLKSIYPLTVQAKLLESQQKTYKTKLRKQLAAAQQKELSNAVPSIPRTPVAPSKQQKKQMGTSSYSKSRLASPRPAAKSPLGTQGSTSVFAPAPLTERQKSKAKRQFGGNEVGVLAVVQRKVHQEPTQNSASTKSGNESAHDACKAPKKSARSGAGTARTKSKARGRQVSTKKQGKLKVPKLKPEAKSKKSQPKTKPSSKSPLNERAAADTDKFQQVQELMNQQQIPIDWTWMNNRAPESSQIKIQHGHHFVGLSELIGDSSGTDYADRSSFEASTATIGEVSSSNRESGEVNVLNSQPFNEDLIADDVVRDSMKIPNDYPEEKCSAFLINLQNMNRNAKHSWMGREMSGQGRTGSINAPLAMAEMSIERTVQESRDFENTGGLQKGESSGEYRGGPVKSNKSSIESPVSSALGTQAYPKEYRQSDQDKYNDSMINLAKERVQQACMDEESRTLARTLSEEKARLQTTEQSKRSASRTWDAGSQAAMDLDENIIRTKSNVPRASYGNQPYEDVKERYTHLGLQQQQDGVVQHEWPTSHEEAFAIGGPSPDTEALPSPNENTFYGQYSDQKEHVLVQNNNTNETFAEETSQYGLDSNSSQNSNTNDLEAGRSEAAERVDGSVVGQLRREQTYDCAQLQDEFKKLQEDQLRQIQNLQDHCEANHEPAKEPNEAHLEDLEHEQLALDSPPSSPTIHSKDQIDEAVKTFINRHPQSEKLRSLFVKESRGVYLFDEQRVNVKVDNFDQVLVQSRGDFVSAKQFVDSHVQAEVIDMQDRRNQLNELFSNDGEQSGPKPSALTATQDQMPAKREGQLPARPEQPAADKVQEAPISSGREAAEASPHRDPMAAEKSKVEIAIDLKVKPRKQSEAAAVEGAPGPKTGPEKAKQLIYGNTYAINSLKESSAYAAPDMPLKHLSLGPLSDFAKQRKIAYSQVPVIGMPYKHSMPDKKASQLHPDVQRDCRHHKMILLGDKGVGKTSLLMRYIYHEPEARQDNGMEKSSSAAAFVFSRSVETNEGIEQFNIWDIAYQEGFIRNIREYYDQVESACVVFDATDRRSYEECKLWATEMAGIAKRVVVAANKIDLEGKRGVSKEEAAGFARSQGFTYHEVSARQNIGLGELFHDLESESQDWHDGWPMTLKAQPSSRQEEISLQLASLNFECDVRIKQDNGGSDKYFRYNEHKTKQGDFRQIHDVEDFLPKLASIQERLEKLLNEARHLGMMERPEYIEALQKEEEINGIVHGLYVFRGSEDKRWRRRCLALGILFCVILLSIFGAGLSLYQLGAAPDHVQDPAKPDPALVSKAKEAQLSVWAYEAAYIKKIEAGLRGYQKMVQAHMMRMQTQIEEFNKLKSRGLMDYPQIEGLKELLASEQKFSSARLLNAKLVRQDSIEVITLSKQLSTLRITSADREQSQLLADAYSLEAFLRQRQFLAKDVKLAAVGLQTALKFYQGQAKSAEWLKKQHEFFESQVASCMQAAENIVKYLRELADDFEEQVKALEADLQLVRQVQRATRLDSEYGTDERITECKSACQLSTHRICSNEEFSFNEQQKEMPSASTELLDGKSQPNSDEVDRQLSRLSRIHRDADDLAKSTSTAAQGINDRTFTNLPSRPLSPQEHALFSQYTVQICTLAHKMSKYDAKVKEASAKQQQLDEQRQTNTAEERKMLILSCTMIILCLLPTIWLAIKQRSSGSGRICKSSRVKPDGRAVDDVEKEVGGLLHKNAKSHRY